MVWTERAADALKATGLMEQRKKKVPVFLRQAIRQGIGVTIAVLLGYAVADTLGGSQQKTGVQWLQGCKWAAITVVVVASPMLGKVSQVSMERTIGTVCGGCLGLGISLLGHGFGQDSDMLFTGIAAFVVAFSAVIVGWALSLDYSAKLFTMTFVLVIMGSERASDAYLVALTRISGIVGGVFVMLLLSVIIFPKSASHQAADNMTEGLVSLVNLSRLAWRTMSRDTSLHGTKGRLERARSTTLQGQDSCKSLDSVLAEGLKVTVAERDETDLECEKTLMDVYDKLVKCDECLPVAANEVYIRTFRGRWCFLPGIPGLRGCCSGLPSSWRLPQREIKDLATCMRRVARVLWALHVILQEGFDDKVGTILKQIYPPNMMRDLETSSQEAIIELAQAFPYQPSAGSAGLSRFQQAVAELVQISAEQRSMAVQQLQRFSANRQSVVDLTRLVSKDDEVSGTSETAPDRPSSNGFKPPMHMSMDKRSSGPFAESPSQQWQSEDEDAESIAEKLDIFPPSRSGYTQKVRWFSFQFVMQQLAEELEDMHTATQLVLAALPKPPKKGRRQTLLGPTEPLLPR
ncbi:g4567 [Coccomyxa viridis]|uniref:G4567 protein n=1 Tax=Coccomyxa viridis TaxID=1274662 RepID=A0ABP1FQK9_9CHLO